MTDSSSVLNLALLDEVETVTPDPQIFRANTAALRIEQAEYAARVEGAAVPPHWRAVRALDGWPTVRTETAGEPALWLAGTAVPRARAEALLRGFDAGEQNATLPSVAAGAELRGLLAGLPDYRAVYVFEADVAALAAVLRAIDFALEIERGRCVFLPPGREEGFLTEHLRRHAGLLPPGNIVVLPGVAPARIEEIRRICQRVASEVLAGRQVRLKEMRGTTAEPKSAAAPRLAVLAFSPDPLSRFTSAALANAARRAGWEAMRCAVCGPRDVHVLPHVEALTSFAPNLTVCLRQSRARLSLPLTGTVCEWVTDAGEVPPEVPADGVLRLAASPRTATALRAAAQVGAVVADWYWGCDAESAGDDPVEPELVADDAIAIVADFVDDSPAACGVDQPSHQQLWKGLQAVATRRWETGEPLEPGGLLADAERATGVRLGDPSLRGRLLELIATVLIPAATAERIAQAVTPGQFRIAAIGKCWEVRPGKEIQTFTHDIFSLRAEPPGWRPRAAIFGGAGDPLSPSLLHAGSLGWPLWIHSPGRRPLTGALGQVLHPQQHFQPFRNGVELRGLLRALREQPEAAAAMGARTRQHVRANHSYRRRLEALLQLVAAARVGVSAASR